MAPLERPAVAHVAVANTGQCLTVQLGLRVVRREDEVPRVLVDATLVPPAARGAHPILPTGTMRSIRPATSPPPLYPSGGPTICRTGVYVVIREVYDNCRLPGKKLFLHFF